MSNKPLMSKYILISLTYYLLFELNSFYKVLIYLLILKYNALFTYFLDYFIINYYSHRWFLINLY